LTAAPHRRGRTDRLEFEPAGKDRFLLRGELTFATAAEALERSRELFRDHAFIELDLSGVTAADSAGLALLLEWITWARGSARELQFHHIPEQLLAIAQISEVEDLLRRGQAWSPEGEEAG
jgi:phospholipid transport system transporter-binding protein